MILVVRFELIADASACWRFWIQHILLGLSIALVTNAFCLFAFLGSTHTKCSALNCLIKFCLWHLHLDATHATGGQF